MNDYHHPPSGRAKPIYLDPSIQNEPNKTFSKKLLTGSKKVYSRKSRVETGLSMDFLEIGLIYFWSSRAGFDSFSAS